MANRRMHPVSWAWTVLLVAAMSMGLTAPLGVTAAAAAENSPLVTTPANFRVDVDRSSVTVEWDPSTSAADVTIYHVTLKGGVSQQYLWTVDPTMTLYLQKGRTYEMQVQAQDAAYLRSDWSELVEFTTPEEFPVSTPANIQVSESPGRVTVDWDPSTSAAGVLDYVVTLHGTSAGAIARRTTATTATFDVPPGGELDVTVQARDNAYRWSDSSAPVEVTVAAADDWEPPGAPTNLRATIDSRGRAVSVAWDAATGGAGPLTYHLHVDGSGEIETSTQLHVELYPGFVECTTNSRQTFTFVVTATSHGFESPLSEPITLCMR